MGEVGPADFFSQNLTHTKGPAAGNPFVFEPWQRGFVDELYKRDGRGKKIYKRAILGIPRGNGKSPLAGGLGLYELLTREDEPDIVCAWTILSAVEVGRTSEPSSISTKTSRGVSRPASSSSRSSALGCAEVRCSACALAGRRARRSRRDRSPGP
ncbi:MAG TPA: hypothetical protein VK273_07385 [Gaiellaceae bacterium]|nr:hypothetical protein [Gaiellaceae bacterium]